MEALVDAALIQVALEGQQGCKLDHLFDLIDEHVLPIGHFHTLDTHIKTHLWKQIQHRKEVQVERIQTQPSTRTSEGNTRKRKLSTPTKVSNTQGENGVPDEVTLIPREQFRLSVLVGHRSSLLHQLTDLDKLLLAATGKSRRAGLIQKDLQELLKCNSSMLYPSVYHLEKLGLIQKVNTRVKTSRKEEKTLLEGGQCKAANASSYLRATNNLYLTVFAPKDVRTGQAFTWEQPSEGNKNDMDIDLKAESGAQQASSIMAEDQGSASIRDYSHSLREIIELLQSAPQKTIVLHEIKSSLGISDKNIWNFLVRTLIRKGIVEECLYQESDNKAVKCLQLISETRTSAKLTDTEDINIAYMTPKQSSCYVESWPVQDVYALISKSEAEGVTAPDISWKCCLNPKKRDVIMKPLLQEKSIAARKVQRGKNITTLYTVSKYADGNEDSSIFSKQNLERQSFILQLLKKQGFVLQSKLVQYAIAANVDKKLFADQKSIKRSAGVLVSKNLCEIKEVAIRHKTVVGMSNAVVFLPYNTNLDEALMSSICKDALSAPTPRPCDTSQLRVVEGVAKMQTRVLKVEEEYLQDQCDKFTLNEWSGKSPVSGNSTSLSNEFIKQRIHGFERGKMTRARVLHHFFWNYVKDTKEKMDMNKGVFIDIDSAMRSMPIGVFLKVVGAAALPREVNAHHVIDGLSKNDRECLLDNKAERRYMKTVNVLQIAGLLGNVLDLSSNGSVEMELKKVVHLDLPKNLQVPKASEVVMHEGKKRCAFQLSSRKERDQFWAFLKDKYCTLDKKDMNPTYAMHSLNSKFSWAEEVPIPLDKRLSIIEEMSMNPKEYLNSKVTANLNKCKVLSSKYSVDMDAVVMLAKLVVLLQFRQESHIKEEMQSEDSEANKLKEVVVSSRGVDKVVSFTKSAKISRKRKVRDENELFHKYVTQKFENIEQKEEIDDQPDVKRRNFSPEDDQILLRCYAISALTQGYCTIQWDQFSIMPSYLLKTAHKRLKALKAMPLIVNALSKIQNVCASKTNKASNTNWKYPKELEEICDQHEELASILSYRGKEFAKAWYMSLIDAIVVVNREIHNSSKSSKISKTVKKEIQKSPKSSRTSKTVKKEIQKSPKITKTSKTVNREIQKSSKITRTSKIVNKEIQKSPKITKTSKTRRACAQETKEYKKYTTRSSKKPKIEKPSAAESIKVPKQLRTKIECVSFHEKEFEQNVKIYASADAVLSYCMSHFYGQGEGVQKLCKTLAKFTQIEIKTAFALLRHQNVLTQSNASTFEITPKFKEMLTTCPISPEVMDSSPMFRNIKEEAVKVTKGDAEMPKEFFSLLCMNVDQTCSFSIDLKDIEKVVPNERAKVTRKRQKRAKKQRIRKPNFLGKVGILCKETNKAKQGILWTNMHDDFLVHMLKKSETAMGSEYDATLKALLTLIRERGEKGLSRSSIMEIFSSTLQEEKLVQMVHQLACKNEIFSINTRKGEFYVHKGLAGKYCVQINDAHGETLMPYRPWLNLSGKVNVPYLNHVKKRVLCFVFLNPGVCRKAIDEHLGFLCSNNLHEVLGGMVSSGLLCKVSSKSKIKQASFLQQAFGERLETDSLEHFFTSLLPHQFIPPLQQV